MVAAAFQLDETGVIALARWRHRSDILPFYRVLLK
jgi:hypothetical protein